MFEAARDYMIGKYGNKQWDELMHKLPRQTIEVLESPEITQWYAESEMRRFAHVVFETICGEDEYQFQELTRNVALAAIHRFLRMIPDLASGRFVLRNIPTFFGRIRRGVATVRVETDEDGRVLIHYSDYRYCRDRLYRLMALGSCEAAAYAATDKLPAAKVETWDRSSMTLAFTLDE
ncbi:hypothetical protein ENSA5_08320 [Enhygromyxa salina]|uniref:Heme NO binding protein n=1 Tax=Enhygromyxa salina TaxID=215803 RepID=A0A2S9YGX3_9BACT|nr:hypothetical protein ENSA5_08320 [Enhygromyxa salina]